MLQSYDMPGEPEMAGAEEDDQVRQMQQLLLGLCHHFADG